jgi:hypothetical protein
MPHYIFLQKKNESLQKYGDNLKTGPVCGEKKHKSISQVNLFLLFSSVSILCLFARFYKTQPEPSLVTDGTSVAPNRFLLLREEEPGPGQRSFSRPMRAGGPNLWPCCSF